MRATNAPRAVILSLSSRTLLEDMINFPLRAGINDFPLLAADGNARGGRPARSGVRVRESLNYCIILLSNCSPKRRVFSAGHTVQPGYDLNDLGRINEIRKNVR